MIAFYRFSLVCSAAMTDIRSEIWSRIISKLLISDSYKTWCPLFYFFQTPQWTNLMSLTFLSLCWLHFWYIVIIVLLIFHGLTVNSKFRSRLYQCLLLALCCPTSFIVNIPPRIGRSAVLRPQDLEICYWICAPFSVFCRSVCDITATSFTANHVSFGNEMECSNIAYTIFYLDQVSY